jgi:hypothetical protein
VPSDDERNGVEILGQHFDYPDTSWGAAAAGAVCVLIAWLGWLILNSEPGQIKAVGDAWRSITVSPNDEQKVEENAYRIEFWTPSSRTKEAYAGEGVPEHDRWEQLDNDEKVEEFGELLKSDSRVQGYRRFEEFGHGRTRGKWGWWWIVGVERSFRVEDLVQKYRDHWGTDDEIYVEVIRRRSEYAK